LVSLLHLTVHLVHAVGVTTGETFHKVAHFVVIGFELFSQAVELVAELLSFFGA
jgi:hypothetical protein